MSDSSAMGMPHPRSKIICAGCGTQDVLQE